MPLEREITGQEVSMKGVRLFVLPAMKYMRSKIRFYLRLLSLKCVFLAIKSKGRRSTESLTILLEKARLFVLTVIIHTVLLAQNC
jgi:hypothetical protein